MKQTYFLLLLLTCFFACKKVDNELADQDAMPSVNTSELSLYEPGGYNPIFAIYPKEIVVGDSITLAGRLKIKEGATITLGKAQAKIAFFAQREYTEPNSGTVVLMDIVRFAVTADMGSGPQSLVIRNGSHVRIAPDITIRTVPVITPGTDTTLVVNIVMNQPIAGFEDRYKDVASISGNIFKSWGVAGTGEVWLQTPIDIYRVSNGQMSSFLKTGDVLTIDGQAVTLSGFNGVAVNKDGTTLYLSVDATLTSVTGRYYLLKMDIATRQVTVLNSTWYRRRDETSQQLVEVSPSQFINSGPAADISIKAVDLRVDSQDRILFVNDVDVFLPNTYMDMNCVSRISETGRLTTLLEGNANSDKFKYSQLFGLSEDGRYAWLAPSDGGLIAYDLELEEQLAKADEAQNLFLVSFEQNPAFRFSATLQPFVNNGNSSYFPLSGSELLQSYGATIGAIKLSAGGIYAWAGLEKGFSSNSANRPPVQTNMVGQARYVDFDGIQMLGTDNLHNLYFMRDGTKSGASVKLPGLYRVGKP